jgi:gas vesicle protein
MEPTDPNEQTGYEPREGSEGQPSQPQDVQHDGEARRETPAPGRAPTVRVEIRVAEGDLRVSGGAAHVTLHTDDEDISGVDRNGVLYFDMLPDSAELAVPRGAAVLVRDATGDLEVEDLDGYLEVSRARGDVEIRGAAAVKLGALEGNLSLRDGGEAEIRDIGGEAEIASFRQARLTGRVGGDLEARDVAELSVSGPVGGDVSVEHCGPVTFDASIGGDLTVEQCAGSVHAGRVGGDAEISLSGAVTLGSVGGDLSVERCAGSAQASVVGGDVEFDEVASVRVEVVGSDLSAKRVSGNLEVNTVGSDATLTDIGGVARIATVGNDLEVRQAPRGVAVSRVGGDASLDTELGKEAEYTINAGGDITLRARGDVSARFVAQSAGGEIRTQLPLSVERGRRRNLVGSLGRGEAAVTLRSGGDIMIIAADSMSGGFAMSEDRDTYSDENSGPSGDTTHKWEGVFGGKKFRVSVDRGPGKTQVHFEGPMDEAAGAEAGASKSFGFEWERGKGARTYGEYDEQLRDLGAKAEKLARQAAEQAQDYAQQAAKKARETDWEGVGREVRTALSRAMSELEDAFSRVRTGWDGGQGGSSPKSDRPSAQRVRIEQDDVQPEASAYSAPAAPMDGGDREAQRRSILEQLRSGAIPLDEAERKLNDLR